MTKLIHKMKRGTSVAFDSADIERLAKDPTALAKLGIGASQIYPRSAVANGVALDAGITQPVTTAANGVPVQFLQEFLAGVVNILVTARRGDMLAPIATAGKWSDEEIVQTVMEHLATPSLYKDHGGIDLASYNATYERRTIVRFELGVQLTKLDDERSGSANINSAQEKRAAVALAFEILRNEIFFNGFDAGSNRTYGFLNDPNLPAYVTVAAGASTSTTFALKTVAEIVTDLVTAISALRAQSGSQVDPESMPLILAIASSVKDQLNKSDSSFANGMTVNEWLTKNYPNISTVSVPEFDGANGGANVFYLYAESIAESGTDGGDVVIQIVPSKMQALNTVQNIRGTEEGYTNATAGCYVKRGFAVVRRTGI